MNISTAITCNTNLAQRIKWILKPLFSCGRIMEKPAYRIVTGRNKFINIIIKMAITDITPFIRHHFPWLSAATLRFAEANLIHAEAPEPPIIDLGCGEGAFYTFSKLPTAAIGIDNQISSLSRYHSAGYMNVIKADIQNLPIRSEYASTVISNCVLEHVAGLPEALKEINRILRCRGSLCFTVPNSCSQNMSFCHHFKRTNKMWLAWYNDRLSIRSFWNAREWTDALTQAGFCDIQVSSYVKKTTMYWHTLYASAVLFLRYIIQKLPRKPKMIKRGNALSTQKGIYDIFSLMFGRFWFWIFQKGYMFISDNCSAGGYLFIICKKGQYHK